MEGEETVVVVVDVVVELMSGAEVEDGVLVVVLVMTGWNSGDTCLKGE